MALVQQQEVTPPPPHCCHILMIDIDWVLSISSVRFDFFTFSFSLQRDLFIYLPEAVSKGILENMAVYPNQAHNGRPTPAHDLHIQHLPLQDGLKPATWTPAATVGLHHQRSPV